MNTPRPTDLARKTCVFAGPTLWRDETPTCVSRFGPVVLGSVFRAVEAGYARIGIVDGLFGNAPAVWHKEILYALSQGIEVSGAGSMGALRAAELWQFGMIGFGQIFRMFRSGAWTDDDEVAVLHATAELDLQPLSEAMVNIRSTLRKLRLESIIDRGTEQELIRRIKPLHFSERSREMLARQCAEALGEVRGPEVIDAYASKFVDAKRRDALLLLDYLTRSAAGPIEPRPVFVTTRHWRKQFEHQIADVPALR